MSRVARPLLALVALLFAGLGIAFLVAPARLAAAVDLELATATARTEIRAIYGGLELGVALYLFGCLAAGRVRMGLLAAGALLVGAGMGRAVGILVEGSLAAPTPWLLATEVLGGGLCLAAARAAEEKEE